MQPSQKSPALESLIESMFGNRVQAIETMHCMPAPVGCGKSVQGFRDQLSENEYRISGLCQNCQDSIWPAE